MQFDEFVGEVQHRARFGTQGDAMRAIYATLETLGERLYGDEADDLAAQLPPALGAYLRLARRQESFDLDEFFERIARSTPAPSYQSLRMRLRRAKWPTCARSYPKNGIRCSKLAPKGRWFAKASPVKEVLMPRWPTDLNVRTASPAVQ